MVCGSGHFGLGGFEIDVLVAYGAGERISARNPNPARPRYRNLYVSEPTILRIAFYSFV